MSLITIDINEAMRRLRKAGFAEDQTQLVMQVLSNMNTPSMAELHAGFAKLHKDIVVLKWMTAVVMAGVGAQLVKLFFA